MHQPLPVHSVHKWCVWCPESHPAKGPQNPLFSNCPDRVAPASTKSGPEFPAGDFNVGYGGSLQRPGRISSPKRAPLTRTPQNPTRGLSWSQWLWYCVCGHLAPVVSASPLLNPRPSAALSLASGSLVSPAQASESGESSLMFNGMTYQRSQAFVMDHVRRLGDSGFRDRLRDILAPNVHVYVDENQFMEALTA